MRRRGFTVIEVLVAMVIMMISVLALTLALIYAIKFSKLNLLREQALYKAEKLVNYLVSLPYTDTCLQAGTYNCSSGTSCCDGFAGDRQVSYSVSDNGSDLKKIEVNVEFSYGSYNATVHLERLKGNW
ncbi:N-terminal methylation motif-containing protein [Desulfurobacterium pacificum]|uniref:N-terminal methylation motif-containing protein n=1 Tax=Desulfurobacterium pacificum TaxID=240166 RepID=A0ABY1NNI0_9BACT|nr:prepilin-type N-terminal cleavage/methylation domain-containing protein [Desulfurobacterium pacificum]SMP14236.1 N-terminal methylation motif-containing protein [Desulfurobacterium pacificum]